MFVINVFGLGVIYRVLELPSTLVAQMESVANEANVSFLDIFFDFEWMEKCGNTSFMDLPTQQTGVGCFIHQDTIFEIRQQRKKLKHFPLNELLRTDYLFPMYKTKSLSLDVTKKDGFHYYFLYQVIKGRVAKYVLDVFNGIDSLEFITTTFTIENQSFDLVTGLTNDGTLLHLENDDSVVIEQRVLPI